MANLSSIARPYALAAFDYASEKNELPLWQVFLSLAAEVIKHPSVTKLLNNPAFTNNNAYQLFSDILGTLINEKQKNFIHLLAQNKRLLILPDIAENYGVHYAAFQKISSVRLVTAVAITSEYKQKLTQAIKNRIEGDVALQCEIDPAILGGAMIHIGDRVIDGSLRGKLTRLLENLTS